MHDDECRYTLQVTTIVTTTQVTSDRNNRLSTQRASTTTTLHQQQCFPGPRPIPSPLVAPPTSRSLRRLRLIPRSPPPSALALPPPLPPSPLLTTTTSTINNSGAGVLVCVGGVSAASPSPATPATAATDKNCFQDFHTEGILQPPAVPNIEPIDPPPVVVTIPSSPIKPLPSHSSSSSSSSTTTMMIMEARDKSALDTHPQVGGGSKRPCKAGKHLNCHKTTHPLTPTPTALIFISSN